MKQLILLILKSWLCPLLVFCVLTSPVIYAQSLTYPSKTVRLINNFPAGGPSDVLARSLGEALQNKFKRPFVVENYPGAGGNIGVDMVAKSPADGHTILFGIDTAFTVNPHIYKNLPFKTNDLKPVMIMASSGLLVGTFPGTQIQTLKDLVGIGKKKTLNFSSGGNGSPGHLAVQIFTDAAAIKIQHVPYKGNGPAVTAILSGEVDAGVLAIPGMLPHVKAGKINALAVTSQHRSPMLPNVPTVAEQDLKELELEVLYVAMVPNATPESVVLALQKVMAEALQRTDIQTRLANLDLFYEGFTGAAAQQRLNDLSSRYSRIAQTTGMQPE